MTCECCYARKAIDRTVEFPGVPMVFRLCIECLKAGVVPYDVLLTCIWTRDINIDSRFAERNYQYHNKTFQQFVFDCMNFNEKMDEAMGD